MKDCGLEKQMSEPNFIIYNFPDTEQIHQNPLALSFFSYKIGIRIKAGCRPLRIVLALKWDKSMEDFVKYRAKVKSVFTI